MKLQVHNFIPVTRVEGPGVRACIQVQGCSIHCPGCAVPFTWPEKGGKTYETTELTEKILQGPVVEGVTFLGGEPFAQAFALAEIGRELKNNGLSVLTFTGYLLEDLQQANRPDYDSLISVTDLLIDGPFCRELLDTRRPWIGSSNQSYHFLTTRYQGIEQKLKAYENKVEVRIRPDGRILINGLLEPKEMKSLLGI